MRIPAPVLAAALAGVLAFRVSDASAGCTTGGLSFFPSPKSDLPANGRVIVEGDGELEPTVRGLGDDTLILATDGDAIPLHVVAIQHGGWRVSQAILAPTRPLTPGLRYALRASAQGSPLDERLRNAWRVPAWKAADALSSSPRWTAPPARAVPVVGRGCPPHAYVSVRVPVESPEHLLGVVAEVRPLLRGAKPSRFLVPVYDGAIALGHTGCSAPILLTADVPHLVTLTAVDLAGHETPAPGGVLVIKGPS
ncbi:MAG: hypothetical protein QM820_37160 [Minicystis sp.]